MPDTFEGKPDARQMADAKPVTRFRPRYRALSIAEVELHDKIKAKAEELEALIGEAVGTGKPAAGRYAALAITALEESVMWGVKALTA